MHVLAMVSGVACVGIYEMIMVNDRNVYPEKYIFKTMCIAINS